tara:strand:+ start:4860 stop:5294 length:435 start_codon:yes stop_codon:yes gene_type:complete
MEIFVISWFDEAMEKRVLTVSTETEASAREVWEEHTRDYFCAEIIEIESFFEEGEDQALITTDTITADKGLQRTHYHVEIVPGVLVDVYDVLTAWGVTNPAYQHLIKKALKPGNRGHKDMVTDAQDIIDSAIRAKQLIEKGGDL